MFQEPQNTEPSESNALPDAATISDVKTDDTLKDVGDIVSSVAAQSSAAPDEELKEENILAAAVSDAVKTSRNAEKKKARKQKVRFRC